MSSSSSLPPPRLPLETHATILRFCDPSTLAVSSRVCLAWLELAGPILYEHITIRGKDQLDMMIGSEAELASVAPFVSLTQTRTFTYVLQAKGEKSSFDIGGIYSPLQVEDFVIDMQLKLDTVNMDRVDEVNLVHLLRSFNPTHFHLLARPASKGRVDCTFWLPGALEWSQLRKITFVNALTDGVFTGIPFVIDRTPLLDLVFDVSTLGQGSSGLKVALGYIWGDLRRAQATDAVVGPAFGHVQVWVHDEDEVTLARTMLVDCSCTSLDIGVKTPAHA